MSELKQFTSLRQTLALAPQMHQSLKILQANTHELRQLANDQLNSNPLLEELKPETETVSINDADTYQAADGTGNDSRDFFFNSIPERESFQEHLRNQAAFDIDNPETFKAFCFLADFLDERGFLGEDAFEEARDEEFPQETIDAALRFMQNCEPCGVGARNVWENYMIQLKRKKRANSLAYAILESCVPLLEKRKIPEIAKTLFVTERDVETAIDEIATLDPAPAKTFSDENVREISADIVFQKTEGAWSVGLTNEYVPKLRINNTYREMIGRGKLSKEDSSYIRDKIREGKFIIDAIENRQTAIARIGGAILEKQYDFFEKGREYLRPLTMTEVAEELNLNPATVSRAVAGKYARIGYTLMPLKDFFAGGYSVNEGESSLASTSVKEEIKSIVAVENHLKPLSDGKIADILKSKNIDIARRTVAKYREELGIPTKSLRKRFS